MKRIMIKETDFAAPCVVFRGSDLERVSLIRVTTDGSSKFNTIICYDEKDEIYEHWDAMYCWEEPESKLLVSKTSVSLSEYLTETFKAIDTIPSILFDEMKREYERKNKALKRITEAELFDRKPKVVIKNLTEDKT